MKKVLIRAVKIYQKTLSLDHGILKNEHIRVCRFEPTCSEYTINAIEKYGSARGITKGIWRILRCNPWNRGGFDPLK